MTTDRRHRELLLFVRKIVDVSAGYSKENLYRLVDAVRLQYPVLRDVAEAYVHLAHRSDVELSDSPGRSQSSRRRKGTESSQMHLFDLLRDRRLFPTNTDLSAFAGRVLPNMSRRRFDKMSRGDIAARIIEYLETRDPKTREQLEVSMRQALDSGADRPSERRSFLSQWERIIKGIPL